jgi:hypothetical protein
LNESRNKEALASGTEMANISAAHQAGLHPAIFIRWKALCAHIFLLCVPICGFAQNSARHREERAVNAGEPAQAQVASKTVILPS